MNNNKSKKKSIIKYLVITITALYTPFAIMMCMNSIQMFLVRDNTATIMGWALAVLTLLPYILLYFAKDKKSMILIYFAIANELLMMTGVAIYEKKESEWIS